MRLGYQPARYAVLSTYRRIHILLSMLWLPFEIHQISYDRSQLVGRTNFHDEHLELLLRALVLHATTYLQ